MDWKNFRKAKLDPKADPELVRDIRNAQRKLEEAISAYYELRDKHGDLWPDYIEDKLSIAHGYLEMPIESEETEGPSITDWVPIEGSERSDESH
jgi:hypothetical protein